MADMTQVRLLTASPDVALGTVDNVFVCFWRRDTTVAAVMQIEEHFGTFRAKHPDGVWILVIVEEKASLPGGRERQAMAEWMQNNAEAIRVSALVFEGSGFRAAAVRGVVTGLTMIARQPFPHVVFSNIDSAAHWFFDTRKEPHKVFRNPATLIDAVAKLRRMIPAEAA